MGRQPTLIVATKAAEHQLKAQLRQGRRLLREKPRNEAQLSTAEQAFEKWTNYNNDLLGLLLRGPKMQADYRNATHHAPRGTYKERKQGLAHELEIKASLLENILRKLDLYQVEAATLNATAPAGEADRSRRVFVVHGRNEAARLRVTRFLERLELDPVILLERPNAGRTIIEKFEEYAEAGYAVILLTGDDVGKLKEDNELAPRARQNVVLELGYFYGRLGRGRVCVLYERGVERPSDIDGIVYLPVDGSWPETFEQPAFQSTSIGCSEIADEAHDAPLH